MNNIGYTKVPHDLMRCQGLSIEAKGVWILIDGVSDGYRLTLDQWTAMANMSKNTWRRCIRELEQAGLLTVSGNKRPVYHTEYSSEKVQKLNEKGSEIEPSIVQKLNENSSKIEPSIVQKLNPIIKEHKKEQKDLGVRARIREEVMTDMMVEIGCRSVGITPDQYHQLATLIFSDWEFQDLPDGEWTKQHFLGVLRIKAKELRNGNTNRQPIAAGRQQRAEAIARAVAALGTQGRQTQELPY